MASSQNLFAFLTFSKIAKNLEKIAVAFCGFLFVFVLEECIFVTILFVVSPFQILVQHYKG